jgi:ABC-type multidrug transport system fused ATPase/permease subunit
MDKGIVAEVGSHAELMGQRGIYYCLSNEQANSTEGG